MLTDSIPLQKFRMPMIPDRYTRPAILLHWLIAALMILNIALILTVEQFPDEWVRPVVHTHKSLGITVLGLVIVRILWRATHRPPEMPAATVGSSAGQRMRRTARSTC